MCKEEQKLKMSGNKVLRKIFGSCKAEKSEQLRMLRNDELREVHGSPRVVKCRRIKGRGM
jgi:hypothetical protein